MPALTGIQQLGNYATPGTDPLKVQALMDLIPNPDSTDTGGAIAGLPGSTGSGFLDEMSPAAASQLRVELAALKAAVS